MFLFGLYLCLFPNLLLFPGIRVLGGEAPGAGTGKKKEWKEGRSHIACSKFLLKRKGKEGGAEWKVKLIEGRRGRET